MATKEQGQVTLRGRFRPGTDVRLVKVRDEGVLRAEGGETVAEATVDADGCVQFGKGVEVGSRYFIVGNIDGTPVEVRARGNKPGEESAVMATAPVGFERTRLADGSWSDEAPEREKAPAGEVAPAPAQHQVPKGTVQRSDTARGQATPVDPSEVAPYPSQEEDRFSDGSTVQRSDTELGMATPIPDQVTSRQEDSPEGLLQRSDTPHGVTTPIPAGDAVAIQQAKEAAETKAAVGEPVKAASRPVDAAKVKKAPARKAPAKRKAAAKKPAAKTSAARKPARKPAASSSRKSTTSRRK